jgi:ubiquinone/menaquinone biosynthesis C-methylase UbiE
MSSKQYFEAVATEWDTLRESFFSERVREKAFAAAGLRAGTRAVDVGAGTGFVTEGLLARGVRVVAVDESPAMLAELAAKLGAQYQVGKLGGTLEERGELELREGVATALPLGDGEMDYAFGNMVLHHVEDPAAALRELARVVRPGGAVVISDLDAHDHAFLRDEHHDRWMGFARADLRRWLAEAGLDEVTVAGTEETCCATSCCGGERAAVSVFVAVGRKPGAVETAGERSAATGQGAPALRGDADAPLPPEELREQVRERYAAAARGVAAGGPADCGCGCGEQAALEAVTRDLYRNDETAGIAGTAVQASLGCGNPVALAELHAGETVLDLGSGGGLDVLLSARRVGPTGKAYGVDMTDEMLALARRNQAESGIENAEFLKGHLEDVPLPDASVDVVLSNCVVNLSPDKDRVLAEAFRVLKPGGRLAIADVVVEGTFPAPLRRVLELWSGCIAGALEVEDYRARLVRAGFVDADLEITRVYGPELLDVAGRALLAEHGVVPEAIPGRLASAFVRARKPATAAAAS